MLTAGFCCACSSTGCACENTSCACRSSGCSFGNSGCAPSSGCSGAGDCCSEGSCSNVRIPPAVVTCEVDVKVAGTVDCTSALKFIPPAVDCSPVALGIPRGAVDVGCTI